MKKQIEFFICILTVGRVLYKRRFKRNVQTDGRRGRNWPLGRGEVKIIGRKQRTQTKAGKKKIQNTKFERKSGDSACASRVEHR